MSKRTTFIFRSILLMIPVLGLLTITSYSAGASVGYSGSPGDNGNYCATCHSGGNFNNTSTISTDIPASGYVLGQTYTVTVTPNSTAPKHGFEITAENSANAKVGGFVSNASTIYAGAADDTLTHNAPITSGVWSFDWTAPTTSQGAITFYAAINAVNGDGDLTGDQPIKTSLSVNEATAAIARVDNFFGLQENPVTTALKISLRDATTKGAYAIYTIAGKLVKSGDFSNTSDLTVSTEKLNKGIYILKLTTANASQEVKFIKK